MFGQNLEFFSQEKSSVILRVLRASVPADRSLRRR